MPNQKFDIRQSNTNILQDQLNSTVVAEMDSTLASINNELTAPGRLIAQFVPSLVVTVDSGLVVNPNTSKNRTLPPINSNVVSFVGGTITFPSMSGTISNNNGSNASITIGASQFVAVLVGVTSSGTISLVVGNAASSLGAVIVPTSIGGLQLGYIVVESDGGGNILNITNNMLYQFVGTAGGSPELDLVQSNDAFTGNVYALGTFNTSSIRLTGTSNVILRGIANGANGKILTIINATAYSLTISNQDSGAIAADQIVTGTGEDISVAAGGGLILQYDATSMVWVVIGSSVSAKTVAPPTGLFVGGYNNPTYYTTIDYVNIETLGNAINFGNLSAAKSGTGSFASSTRGVFAGGETTGATASSTIEYVTIATTSNTSSFGMLTMTRSDTVGLSNSTIGLIAGAYNSASYPSSIDYVTIATTSNAFNFGNLTHGIGYAGACASPTIGIVAGGTATGNANTVNIDYVTIATSGSGTNFGNLTVGRQGLAGCSSNTIGIFGGGGGPSVTDNTIDYITIATVGNATNFGNLTVARVFIAACSSTVLGLFAGGSSIFLSNTPVNTIDYVTIATVGNATNFGNLTVARSNISGCSNAHGGLT